MGFKNNNPFWRLASDSFVSSQKQWQNQPLSFLRPIYSISSASPEMACVLPKSRTSTVGCSVRSISHNLALLPPRGNVNARWFLTPHYELEGPSDSTVGLLLIPFPYWIDEHAFKQSNRTSAAATPGWGWFDVEQTWLPDCKTRREQFVDFVESLVKDAQTHGPVSGVVLPELALNFSLFEDITDRLKSISGIDFFISGTSQDWTNQHGNFVSIFPFYQLTDSERNEPIGNLSDLIICRSKHHRWKLDRSQINQYKLNLNEQDDWWECIDLHERILDFFPYRNGSTISTLICEDLARIDPCQAAARAIGPNLLIALLMDGPQLSQRWPGRHATGLTEDPGSSVLTFTSLGLIERQNAQKNAKTDREHPLSYSFALWKDKHNGAKSLDLPRGAEALYLSVTLEHRTEHTLDGRCDKSATCQYRLKHTVPIRSSIKPDWVE